MLNAPFSLDFTTLRSAYAAGLSIDDLITEIHRRIEHDRELNAWIHVLSLKELEPVLTRLRQPQARQLPLFGIPFAIKDNIDLAHVPTTAACREFKRLPQTSAFVVQRLVDAGAIPIGKTNLDQFATGLVGTRSAYGICRNAIDPQLISGGSSSGSAVAVARGHVSFSLGTDTAGSGRIPAAFNDLASIKPSRGLISCSGVVPASRTLDCVNIFARLLVDASEVFTHAAVFDATDAFARTLPDNATPLTASAGSALNRPPTLAIPQRSQWPFADRRLHADQFDAFLQEAQSLGFKLHEIDIEPLIEAGTQLYQGPWLAERFATLRWLMPDRSAVHPIVQQAVAPGEAWRADAVFAAIEKLAELRRTLISLLAGVDAILIPTVGEFPSIEEVNADPLRRNAALGRLTNGANLLDLCVVAIPAGFNAAGLPFGVSLIHTAFADRRLQHLAQQLSPKPVTSPLLPLAVCGAHLSGCALNHQLKSRGARLLLRTKTAPNYQLLTSRFADGIERPILRPSESVGAAIEVEVWGLAAASWGEFTQSIPAPLALGSIQLQDGRTVKGFVGDGSMLVSARDISHWRGWRAYLNRDIAAY